MKSGESLENESRLENRQQRTTLIVGDTIDGQLSTGTRQMGLKARTLADRIDSRPVGVLTGHCIIEAARGWSQAAGMPVITLENEQCRYPNPPMVVEGLATLVREDRPVAVCFPHSMRACQAAAVLAWRLSVPCISAVESLAPQAAGLMVTRSLYGGRLTATLTVDTLPVVLTVMPGSLPGSGDADGPQSEPAVTARHQPTTDTCFEPICMDRLEHRDQHLENAQVIVAGGRGLGGTEQVDLLGETAALFNHAAVGASRGACDMGWLPHSLQIGETGRTVAPVLYLACGISGAPQHLAGMRASRTIVAVNPDPRAAIRNVAHYAVEESLQTFLPLLRQRYEETFTKGETDEDR